MQFELNGVARLTNLGLIRAQGVDGAKFLHNQLTNDFVLLGLEQARLAGWCTPQGRLQASFVGFKRSADDLLLVCGRDILSATLSRLARFILRAQVKLSDASADFAVYGLAGEALENTVKEVPAWPNIAWAKTDFHEASLIALYPADTTRRLLWVASANAQAPLGAVLAQAHWEWGEVRAGIARISTPIMGAFVPQMLNYESVAGVNFKKGCYPGQEVVARSQFRGTLKRRAYLAHSSVALAAGDELFLSSDAAQPCGLVAQAARAPGGGFDAIVSLQISAFEAADVQFGATPVQLVPAPYPLLADL